MCGGPHTMVMAGGQAFRKRHRYERCAEGWKTAVAHGDFSAGQRGLPGTPADITKPNRGAKQLTKNKIRPTEGEKGRKTIDDGVCSVRPCLAPKIHTEVC